MTPPTPDAISTIEILLFPGFDELDAVGPYEVLSTAGDYGADWSVSLVTADPTDTVTASHGLTVETQGILGEPDLLVVPGGGWTTTGGVRREYETNELPPAIAARHDAGATVASVCTGAMLLERAGVLEGRPATTHAVAREDLAASADLIDARVVDDGDVLTAGGVTAGLDLALWLIEREHGADLADRVATELEYVRQREVHVAGSGS